MFKSDLLSSLDVKLSNHSYDEQISLLNSGKLDLGVFVIAETSKFISKVIRENNLRIASFNQTRYNWRVR